MRCFCVKAVILSGGMGKRLRPLTDYIPKPLVPINGTPIIEWQIHYFKKFGVCEFVICAGYRAEQIINFFGSKDFGVKINFSVEKSPLGTGGAVRKARRYLENENFFVINGDVITDMDLSMLKPNSMAVIPLRTSFGIVHLREERVEKFEEKPELFDYWMNAGVYHLQNKTLDLLPEVGNMENTIFPKLARSGKLNAVRYDKAFWCSIDSHKDIEECATKMQAVKYSSFLRGDDC